MDIEIELVVIGFMHIDVEAISGVKYLSSRQSNDGDCGFRELECLFELSSFGLRV